MRGWKWLFIIVPVLLIATCTIPLVLMLSSAVSDEARALMDQTTEALAARDADRLRGLMAEGGDEAEIRAGIQRVFAATPQGAVVECDSTGFSFNSNGSGATRIKRLEVTRNCMFDGGSAVIVFNMVEDARGVRLTGINVSRDGG